MPSFILDAIIVLLLIVTIIIGFKVGFLRIIIKIASSLGGLVIAILFTSSVTSGAIKIGIGDGIHDKVYGNITSSTAFQALEGGSTSEEGVANMLTELGVPSFLSKYMSETFLNGVDPYASAEKVANAITKACVSVFVFIFLLIFSSLLFWILKLIIGKLRDAVAFIKITDGIFGIAFFSICYLVLVFIFLFIVSFVLAKGTGGFVEFMNGQLHLSDGKFGIAKYLYEHNLIGNFFALFL